MDGGGSFIDQACVRIAVLPTGSSMSEERFEELASYLSSLREVALNVLPRRSSRSFSTSASGSATFSHPPSDLRASSISSSDGGSFSGTRFLSKTFSSSRDASSAKGSLSPTSTTAAADSAKGSEGSPAAPGFPAPDDPPPQRRPVPLLPLRARRSSSVRRPRGARAHARAPRDTPALSLGAEDIDAYLRLRYDIIHRNHAGELIVRAPSQWDAFHSRRVWGVMGIVDCTDPDLGGEERDKMLQEAQDEFLSALEHFPKSCVSRVIVFTTPDAAKQRGAQSVMNSPSVGGRLLSVPNEPASELVFGYVPESAKYQETCLELKVQIIHLASLLLNCLDRECWKIERASNELFLSPLDEPNTPDKQSKLVKRRPGRQDKLLADTHLMMGLPVDALAKYTSAIEKAKANSDRLWLAGAMEGWSSAHVFCYIKGGGKVGDLALSSKLIEHYSEIYKLYQKKRIPELEAVAALRVAEFLGRFTTRRKEALEAADHAAAVGESLSSQKRAALWESLARFSEYMKCHRKAAFYMYRVGSLCASKSVWSSSEALLTASAKQFRRSEGKIWPDLHRDILMEAGKSAWEVGDSFLATQHYVEALSLSSSTLIQNRKGDSILVKLLVETTTPAYLPAASELVRLHGLYAQRIPSLLVKDNVHGSADSSSPHNSKNGPFIYNPFEARKREKAAAAASRAVTWVCGEAAQITLQLQNQTYADLPIEIIAVAITDANRAVEIWPASEKKTKPVSRQNSEANGDARAAPDVDEDPQAAHAARVKTLLRNVTRTAETLSETVTLPPLHSSKYIEKTVTVFSRKTGAMKICGIVVRLFRGALVLLSTPVPVKGARSMPPINVIRELPRLDVSIRQEDGEFSSFNVDKQPATIFEGERRRFSVRVRNVGQDEIAKPSVEISSSNPTLIQITQSTDAIAELSKRVFKQGQVYELSVEVFAHRVGTSSTTSEDGVINVSVVYTGVNNITMIRESRAMVSLVVRPAIRIGSFSPFRLPSQNGMYEEEPGRSAARYGLILDVENMVCMPVMIALPPSWRSPDIIASSKFKGLNMFGLDSPCPTVNVLECGASTRLITVIPNEFFSEQGKSAASLALSWAMPGIARNGIAEVFRDDIISAGAFMRKSSSDSGEDPFNRADNAVMEIHTMTPTGRLEPAKGPSAVNGHPAAADGIGVRSVDIRKYYTSTVVVYNRGTRAFPPAAVLDLCVLQHDGRGGARVVQPSALIGAVECVHVGPLEPGRTFEHSFKMRFSSSGIFELNGFVHDWAQDTATSLDAVLIENESDPNPDYSRVSRVTQAWRSQSLRPKSTGMTGVSGVVRPPPGTRAHSFRLEKETSDSVEHKRTRSLVHIRKDRGESPAREEPLTRPALRPVQKQTEPGVEESRSNGLRHIELSHVLCRYTAPFYVIADKWDTGGLSTTESPFGPHAVPVSSAGSRLSMERRDMPQPDKMF